MRAGMIFLAAGVAGLVLAAALFGAAEPVPPRQAGARGRLSWGVGQR